MKIRAEQLPEHLRGRDALLPMYWVAGDETLLCQEACDAIRQRARELQFEEREVHFVDAGFNWQAIRDSLSSLSLFASHRLVELRLSSFRIEAEGRDMLAAFLENPEPDTVLLLSSPRPEAAALKTRWFQTLEAGGGFVQIWPVDSRRFPDWVADRLSRKGLRATPEAIQLLCDRVEGNLLAAAREIEKLALLRAGTERQNETIEAPFIARTVADSARYNVFQMVDHALSGDARRALRSLNRLRDEGSEPLQLLGMMARELRTLLQLCRLRERGMPAERALQQARVWKSRQPVVRRAMEQLDSATVEALLLQAREVDLSVKGMAETPPGPLLEDLLLGMAGHTPIRPNAAISSRTSRSATG